MNERNSVTGSVSFSSSMNHAAWRARTRFELWATSWRRFAAAAPWVENRASRARRTTGLGSSSRPNVASFSAEGSGSGSHAQNGKRLWHGVEILEPQGTAKITLDSSIARAEEGRPDADEGAPLGDGRIQVGAHSH